MRIVHTGDQVRLRAGGLVDVVARGDRMVKVLGNRVEPAEIEGALRQEAGVADAAVEARMNGDVATLYAFVCGVDGATPDRRAIMTSLRRKLPSYMVPRKLLAFPTLPKLPSGKIDRMRMLAMAEHDMDSPTDLTFLAARQANVGVGAPAT